MKISKYAIGANLTNAVYNKNIGYYECDDNPENRLTVKRLFAYHCFANNGKIYF